MRVHTSADNNIAVKIDDVVIKFRPLTYSQRKEVLAQVSVKGGNLMEDRMEMVRLAVKYAVKSVSGLETSEGPYSLQMENGFLTEEGLDDLMNVQGIADALTLGSIQLATSGPFTSLTDDKGNALEGVSVLTGNDQGKKGN